MSHDFVRSQSMLCVKPVSATGARQTCVCVFVCVCVGGGGEPAVGQTCNGPTVQRAGMIGWRDTW